MSDHRAEDSPDTDGSPGDSPDPRAQYRRLPDPVRVEDTVESHDPLPAPDLDTGQDPNRSFVIRYG